MMRPAAGVPRSNGTLEKEEKDRPVIAAMNGLKVKGYTDTWA